MNKDEDHFYFQGKEYGAIDVCSYCDLSPSASEKCDAAPPCTSGERLDHHDVVFKERPHFLMTKSGQLFILNEMVQVKDHKYDEWIYAMFSGIDELGQPTTWNLGKPELTRTSWGMIRKVPK